MAELLVVVSLMVIALILPFTYNFIKNLYAEIYKEGEKSEKQLKEKTEGKNPRTAKDLIESIENFHIASVVMIVLIFLICIISFFLGVFRIANTFVFEENLMLIFVCVQGVLLIAYLGVFLICRPLKTLKDFKKLNSKENLKDTN